MAFSVRPQSKLCRSPRIPVQPGQFRLDILAKRGGHLVFQHLPRLQDRPHPLIARSGRGRIDELEQVFENAAHGVRSVQA
jgi:hypothetical protein